jgi:hypothetical protein
VIYARKVSRENVGCGHICQPIKTALIERYCLVPMTTVRGECTLKPYSDKNTNKLTGNNCTFSCNIVKYLDRRQEDE